MKVSTTALTLLFASSVASATTTTTTSSSNTRSKLRTNNSNKNKNNNNDKKKKALLPVRRSLQWNFDFDKDGMGDWLNKITGNDNVDGVSDWEVILNNNNFGGGGGDGNGQGWLDMMGGINAIKESIDWESMREKLAEMFEGLLNDGNFEGLPDGVNWEAIMKNSGDGGGGEDILGGSVDWQSILSNIDLSSIVVDWESLMEGIDLSDLIGDGFDFNFENILSIDWTNTNAWQELLTDVMDGIDMSEIELDWTDVNACGVLQLVNGIAPSFGVNGNCTCDGNLATGLEIGCGFSGCAFDDGDGAGCGEVSLDMSLAQGEDAGAGLVDIQACTKFNNDDGDDENENEAFEEACISYAVDMSNDGQPVSTCSASYGDGTCGCTIDENSCVTVDCSDIREDAVMEQCMPLGLMRTKSDFDNFIPQFTMLSSRTTVEEQEDNNNGDIIKPNKPKKLKKFRMVGKKGIGKKQRGCKWVENQITKKGKDKIGFCAKAARKNQKKPVKTVGEFCVEECA